MQKNETTVFKDGSYEVNYKSELFKQLFPEDSSKCSDYGESKGYCGKEYSIDISPKKDKLQEDELIFKIDIDENDNPKDWGADGMISSPHEIHAILDDVCK